MNRIGRAPSWRRVGAALVLCLASLALVACGGGGGSGGESTAPVQPGPITPQPAPAPEVGVAIATIEGSPALIGAEIRFAAQAAGGTAPFNFAWTFGDGGTASGSNDRVVHAYATAGTFPVALIVTDARGKSATARSEVQIAAPVNVSISASRMALSIGQRTALTAVHDPIPDVQRYEWSLGDGRTAEGKSIDITYLTRGDYPVSLTVWRAGGLKAVATLKLSILTQTPSISAGATGLMISGTDVNLSVYGDPSQGLVHWDFGDGTSADAPLGPVVHVYRQPGTYEVRVSQTNATEATGMSSFTLQIMPPVPPSAVTISPYQPLSGSSAASSTVGFSGRSADNGGLGETGRRYNWNFGDGSPSKTSQAGEDLKHTFPGPGTYVVSLTATNAFGLSSSGTATIIVGNRQQLRLLAGNELVTRQKDGPALSATFDRIRSLSFDADGNLFISDAGNGAVRMLSPQGMVSTVDLGDERCGMGRVAMEFSLFAYGSQGLVGAPLGYECYVQLWDRPPRGMARQLPIGGFTSYDNMIWALARAADGRIYAVQSQGSVLRRRELDGSWTDLAGKAGSGGYMDGKGDQARISADGRSSIGFDAAGMLYISQVYTIRRVSADGTITTIAGKHFNSFESPGNPPSRDGIGIQARFASINDMAVAADGTVYALEGRKIRKLAPNGEVTTLPVDLSLDGWPTSYPIAIALSPSGTLVVADSETNTIRRINDDFTTTVIAGKAPMPGLIDGVGQAAAFWGPNGIAQGPSGALYVADSENRAVRKIALDGTVTTLAIVPRPAVTLVHCCIGGQNFPSLGQLVVDEDENIYVADTDSNAIRKITPNGLVSVVAGIPGSNGLSDGASAAALFNGPIGLARDAVGNLYVGDTDNHAIRKITPAGVVFTVAGAAGAGSFADGNGTVARFNQPLHIAASDDGTLWVVDRNNQRIRKIAPDGTVSTVAGRGSLCLMSDATVPTDVCVHEPIGIARDKATGELYYTDASAYIGRGGVRQMTPDGRVFRLAPGGVDALPRTGALAGAASAGKVRGIALLTNGQIAVTAGDLVLITDK